MPLVSSSSVGSCGGVPCVVKEGGAGGYNPVALDASRARICGVTSWVQAATAMHACCVRVHIPANVRLIVLAARILRRLQKMRPAVPCDDESSTRVLWVRSVARLPNLPWLLEIKRLPLLGERYNENQL